jgi:hypothetical protein
LSGKVCQEHFKALLVNASLIALEFAIGIRMIVEFYIRMAGLLEVAQCVPTVLIVEKFLGHAKVWSFLSLSIIRQKPS